MTSTISLYGGYTSGTYGDANVIYLFSNYQYPIVSNNSITAAGNISGNAIIGQAFYWANGVNLLNTLYSNANAAGFLPIYSGNVGGTLTTNAQPNINVVGPLVNLTAASNVSMASHNINFLAMPVAATDAASKAYVDSIAQGLTVKAAVDLTTAAALPGYIYYNGPANDGVGATLTGLSLGELTVDGVVAQVNDRVLIKDEVGGNAAYNGIYVVTRNGVGTTYLLTRASDFNNPLTIYGAYTYTVGGTVNTGTSWINTNSCSSGITMGVTPITFTQMQSAGTITAGNAISIGTGVISVNYNANTLGVNGSNQLYVTGNLPSANITTLTSNTITTTNITTNSFTGNVVIVNGSANATTVNAAFINSTGPISTTGNVYGSHILGCGASLTGMYGNSNVIAFLPTYAGALGAGTANIVGNISANYYYGNGAFLTGIAAGGSCYSNANVAAYLPTYSGNLNPNNIAANGIITIASTTGNVLSTTGNIAAGYLYGNISFATGLPAPTYGNSIAIGYSAVANTTNFGISIGANAGHTCQQGNSIAIGLCAGLINQGTSQVGVVGYATAVGSWAGKYNQHSMSVAIGAEAGTWNQSARTVAIGQGAGELCQSVNAVAVGWGAGGIFQGCGSIAIGYEAGDTFSAATNTNAAVVAGNTTVSLLGTTTGTFATGMKINSNFSYTTPTIGSGLTIVTVNAANLILSAAPTVTSSVPIIASYGQANGAIAIGAVSGKENQGVNAVAIGGGAGSTSQGGASIAIGHFAGQLNQANNSIILNATGAALNQTTANTYTVKPVRSVTATVSAPTVSPPAGFLQVGYNPTTGEFIYYA